MSINNTKELHQNQAPHWRAQLRILIPSYAQNHTIGCTFSSASPAFFSSVFQSMTPSLSVAPDARDSAPWKVWTSNRLTSTDFFLHHEYKLRNSFNFVHCSTLISFLHYGITYTVYTAFNTDMIQSYSKKSICIILRYLWHSNLRNRKSSGKSSKIPKFHVHQKNAKTKPIAKKLTFVPAASPSYILQIPAYPTFRAIPMDPVQKQHHLS